MAKDNKNINLVHRIEIIWTVDQGIRDLGGAFEILIEGSGKSGGHCSIGKNVLIMLSLKYYTWQYLNINEEEDDIAVLGLCMPCIWLTLVQDQAFHVISHMFSNLSSLTTEPAVVPSKIRLGRRKQQRNIICSYLNYYINMHSLT